MCMACKTVKQVIEHSAKCHHSPGRNLGAYPKRHSTTANILHAQAVREHNKNK